MRKLFSTMAIAILAATLFSGCAVFNPDNTPTLNLVRKHVVPEKTGYMILSLPLVVPVGAVAVAADAAVVHPLSVIDDAALDTQAALWNGFDWNEEYATACVGVPWRAALSVPAFAGAYLGRVLFDVPNRESQARAAEQVRAAIVLAHKLMEEGKPVLALRVLSKYNLRPLLQHKDSGAILADFEIAALEATWRARRYPLMQPTWQTARIMKSDKGPELRALIDRIRKEGDPLAQWHGTAILIAVTEDADARIALVRESLKNDSAAYRLLVLQWLSNHLSGSDAMRIRQDLANVSTSDPDATNRTFAHSLLAELMRRAQSAGVAKSGD